MRTVFIGLAGTVAALLLMVAMNRLGWISLDPMIPVREIAIAARHALHF